MIRWFGALGIAAFGWVPQAAQAQSAVDGLSCLLAFRETAFPIAECLTAEGWAPGGASIDDVVFASIFLGNLKGQEPATWAETHTWARGLSDGYEASLTDEAKGQRLTFEGTTIWLGGAIEGKSSMLVVSDTPQADMVQLLFPATRKGPDGQRTVVTYTDPTFQISASEMLALHLPAELRPKGEVSFVATFIFDAPSGQ